MTFDHSPRVVWPAIGSPAFCDSAQPMLTMVVAYDGAQDSLRDWAMGLSLRAAGSEPDYALELGSIDAADAQILEQRVPQYVQARGDNHPLFAIRMRLAALPSLSPPRSAQVFSLWRAGHLVRPNAVAVLAANSGHLRLAFATDLHISHAWTAIGAAVEAVAPELAAEFCHPQRLLRAFVDECNRLAARGELDLVVLGGDLVDHVYRESIVTGGTGVKDSQDTNVQLLVDLLASLSVPVLAIPGNHDYRVNPWRPRVFGLGSVGIAPQHMQSFLRKAGLWERWPLKPSDRRALHTEHRNGTTGLWPHLNLVAPATDFHVDVRGLRLVFIATGRDMVLHWRSLDWRRRKLLARALPTSWYDPDSEGLAPEQSRWLTSTLGHARHVALFFHAPLLHPHPRHGAEQYIEHIDPGDRDDDASAVSYEQRLQASGLRRGVLFRGVAPLVRALASVRGGAATFSGHVHRSSRIELERASLRPRSVPVDSQHDSHDIIPLHIGASLGHVRKAGGEPPGYLLADFEDGRLRSVRRRRLMP